MRHPLKPEIFQPSTMAVRVARPGFALVVTLSLMALLILLAVGLLTISGVALRSGGRDEAMATARANARLALMLALGDLQVAMGPDERVTAAADQSAATTGPHGAWVGVYEAWSADQGVTKRPSPKLVGWLVSAPDAAKAADLAYPAAAAADEVPMVGIGSLGTAGGDGTVTVPGVAVTSGGLRGRLGWWTGDESMKAHVTAGAERPEWAEGAAGWLGANAGISPDGAVLEALGGIAVGEPGRASYLTTRQLELRNEAAGGLFHDVTTASHGLPVDVTRGRFKLDYSIFAQGARRQTEGLPLYKADGAVNGLGVANGRLVSDQKFRAAGSNLLNSFAHPSNQSGIHFEELWIYSNLYRNIRWQGGRPELWLMDGSENPRAADFRQRALADPWFNYSRPVFASVQFVLSFVSRPSATAPGKFRMLMQMDAVVKVWNPNNVRVVVPPGASFAVQLLAVPFQVQWSVTPARGGVVTRPQSGAGNNTYAMSYGNWPSSGSRFGQRSFQWLRGNIGGLAAKGASSGYTLEPGECKVFGYDKETSTASWAGDPNVNLSPGWGPGRQALIVADFGADQLDADDTIEFIVSPDAGALPTGGTRTYCNKWIGHRAAGAASQGGNGGLAIGSSSLPTSVPFQNADAAFFPTVRSSQRLSVSQYSTAKPFLLFGHYLNVEQPGFGTRDAFPSAARLMTNTAVGLRRFSNLEVDQLAAFQEMWRCDPLPLAYDSPLIDINSQDQGRFGGGHAAGLGVARCAVRQLDLMPPLSLMSLSHAIANGFADRFGQAAERVAKGLNVMQSDGINGAFKFDARDIAFSTVSHAAPQVERAIGNSFASPFIRPNAVTGSGTYHSGTAGAVPLFDHSYLANAALFDTWFCSSLHDGTLFPKGGPLQDPRGAAEVLGDFLEEAPGERAARLLNPRVVPAGDVAAARERLISGSGLHPEAMRRLAAHVFLEGAFNVNSTRKEAWKAVLATSRGGLKIGPNGRVIEHPGRTPLGSAGLVGSAAAVPSAQATEMEQWSGYRELSDEQIDELAGRIVDEVKRRGPFLSLADFVNRRPGASGDEAWLGAVQAAIEAAGLNDALKGGGRGLRAADFGRLPGAGVAAAGGGMARSAGIPGYVMQSDVLASFANQLTPRGDTFRLRGYGAATDAGGKVIAEAWCEALVQRLPEYVDPEDLTDTARGDLKQPLNRVFGRRFAVISFQWLPRDAV